MRKKRKLSRSDIVIDLTSLLDVIFILLLVVLCGQNSMGETLKEMQADTKRVQAEAEAEYKLYEEQLEIAGNLSEYVWAVSIVVPYNENEISKRQICLLQEGNEIEKIDLVGNDIADSVEAFRETLTRYIIENEDRPVILSLNDDDDYILYRDEVMVNDIFNELANQFSNVYIKGSMGEKVK